MGADAVAIAICVLATAALLGAEVRGSVAGKIVAKPIASTAFIALAVVNGALATPYGIAVLVALVCSWFGDVFLISKREPLFLAGLVAFLLGHVAYGAAFVLSGVLWLWAALSLIPLAFVFVAVHRWLVPRVSARMKRPVLAYMVVITAMVGLSVGLVAATGEPIYLAAAVMFFVSDLAVARERFVQSSVTNRLWGLPLYYGAQIVFGLTVSL